MPMAVSIIGAKDVGPAWIENLSLRLVKETTHKS